MALSLSEISMRIVCRATTGASIGVCERHLGEKADTEYFPLSIGAEYLVCGMLVIKGRIDFLVWGDSFQPFWVPSALFDLLEDRLPSGWHVCITQAVAEYSILFDIFGITCVMGYASLAKEYAHYVGLLERDASEMLRFYEFFNAASVAG